MSNFSNLGFSVSTQEAYEQLLDKAFRLSREAKTNEGTYAIFTDNSGAELYIQFNTRKECIGANPHFKGKSLRTVCLTAAIDGAESILDGSFHCWADPSEENNPDSGTYPFVFDVPDFRTIGPIDFPTNRAIQLTAFAQQIDIYDSEIDYADSQTTNFKFATQSFIPTGLFSPDDQKEPNPERATGLLSGIIKDYQRKKNHLTDEAFYWLLIDTLGGEIDVVADTRYFEKEPQINGVIHGQFWLSGRLLNLPNGYVSKPKRLWQKIFGR